MSRTSERKRIHYVRAAYGKGIKPKESFQALIAKVLAQLPKVAQTEVALPSSEVLMVRFRGASAAGHLLLAIGLGVPNEAMSTLGVGVSKAQDDEKAEQPPAGRAFKLADAFCLLDENELLVCLDGGMRVPKVESYLRGLMDKAGLQPKDKAFELVSRMNQKAARTIAVEGVKALKVRGTVYAATQVLDEPESTNQIAKGWSHLIQTIRTGFEQEVESAAEKEALADHLSEINVETLIRVEGGAYGEPIVLQSLEEAAKALQDDAPLGAEVTLVTKKGNEVSVSNLTLRTAATIKRLKEQNGLDHLNAWEKLSEARTEFVNSKRWKT